MLPPACGGRGVEDEDEELEALARKLQDEDARKRRTAVKGLAALGSPAAWELVLGALRDEEPEVADQAQLELAGLAGEDALGLLHGRDGLGSRDEGVRARVAEALGRARRDVAPEELLEAVGDREAVVQRLGWWSVERLALGGSIGGEDREDLVRAAGRAAASERDLGVRGAALVAFAALAPEQAAEEVFDALGPREEPGLRAAALAACATLARVDPGRAEGARAAIRAAALDGEASQAVRLAAIDALETLARARVGARDAAGALVDLLGVELRPRTSTVLLATLRAVTGLGYGARVRPWRAALAELPPDWVPADADRPSDAADGVSVSRLAGLPLLSDRIAVLIDMSGSIWQTRDGGRTLKQLVDRELRLFLESLPTDTRFNLIPYATEPTAWEDGLVNATPRNVARALEWFEDSRLRGRGAVWEAIELALEDEETDTLIVLTDGAPTGGRHWNLDLMVPLLLERNRTRRVAFDSILTDPRPSLKRHWTRLAEGSGGLSVDVRFSDG